MKIKNTPCFGLDCVSLALFLTVVAEGRGGIGVQVCSTSVRVVLSPLPLRRSLLPTPSPGPLAALLPYDLRELWVSYGLGVLCSLVCCSKLVLLYLLSVSCGLEFYVEPIKYFLA